MFGQNHDANSHGVDRIGRARCISTRSGEYGLCPGSLSVLRTATSPARQDGGVRKPALVASDVDGTLLDPMERVSDRTARTVQRVVANETPFVLVTGRPPRWMPDVVHGLGVAGVAVCANGAVLYDAAADRVLHSQEIDALMLHDVVRELRLELPGCAFAVERTTDGARDRPHDQFLAEADFRRVWPNTDIHVAGLDEVTGKPAVKLLVLHEHMTSAEMAAVAREVIGHELELTYSTGAGLIEFSVAGVDKASGLAAIAEQLGVDRADVIAFGDMPNDVPMLTWAGHAVAMANAHPAVREVADEVTLSNDEDGVAAYLASAYGIAASGAWTSGRRGEPEETGL
jgi:Cof subfamily protein (haloacid dehalogenase superfamily)